MEVILIGWRVHFELCKSLFLQHLYNINKQIFSAQQGKKCDNVLQTLKLSSQLMVT